MQTLQFIKSRCLEVRYLLLQPRRLPLRLVALKKPKLAARHRVQESMGCSLRSPFKGSFKADPLGGKTTSGQFGCAVVLQSFEKSAQSEFNHAVAAEELPTSHQPSETLARTGLKSKIVALSLHKTWRLCASPLPTPSRGPMSTVRLRRACCVSSRRLRASA